MTRQSVKLWGVLGFFGKPCWGVSLFVLAGLRNNNCSEKITTDFANPSPLVICNKSPCVGIVLGLMPLVDIIASV